MKKTLLTTILIILSVLCFEQETRSIAMSNYFFISSGNWNDGSHWNTGEVPPEGSNVFIAVDAVIPAGYTAIANQISLLGGSITVADGGQLKHNTQDLVVTMEKSIAAFNEVNSWSNYYLLAFPFNEDVAVPATMTAAEDNDFYTFDPDYPYAEWRNNKQHVITTVGGTTGYLYANSEDIELSLTGSTYQSYGEAIVTVEVPYTEGSSNIFNGWALLGNPYTCNAYVYAFENGSCVPKEFMVYNADGELVRCFCSSIAPMQGFFVKVEETTTICIKTTAPYVDLGLPSGTLWAACNVGAITPEDYGDYFAWGETQPKDFYDWSTYQYCNGSYNTLTKYCSDASFGYNGFSDTLSILLREDDAATANWGNDWRMPTEEEWQELYNNTTHVWTTQNGVNGRLFTSENGNSLFLPAGGIYSNGSLGSTGSGCYYWSSSLSTESPNLSWQCSFYSNGYNSYEFARFFGISVRPVRSTVPPSSYIINAIANPAEGGEISGSGIFQEGAECTLIATANEGYTFTNWTENDELVSTDANYTFTVTADRNLVANFTSSGSSDHDYVDLGLPSGTLWATCNVGANSPEEYGDYFAWGETQPKDTYNWNSYLYCNGCENSLTKYCNNPDYGYNGYTDTLTILLPEDDAATANWGTDWRMPTREEWAELYYNTTCTWTTQNGMSGRLFTASNGNSIFLPAAGYRSDGELYCVGSSGYYWTSSRILGGSEAWLFYFDSGFCSVWTYAGRNVGRSVRAVRTAFIINAMAYPMEGGVINGEGAYQDGEECTLIATANEGFIFTNWTENGVVVSTDAVYSFTVTNNRTLVANFTIQNYTITVSANPSDGGSVSGGGNYNYGQICTVAAITNSGYYFTNWTENGSVVSTNANYTFTVNNNRSLEANFQTQMQSYTINVSANPTNGGNVTGGGTYQQGQSCTVSASANTGYTFTNWMENNEAVSTDATYTFTVNTDMTLVANFNYNGSGSAPTGAINGLFSVSASRQVYFSQGNLQYIGSYSTPYWKFADNQWDILGTTTGQNSSDQNIDRDLFGWGTSGYNHGADCYQPWSTSISYSKYYAYGDYQYNLYDQTGQADWGYNAICNGNNQENQWRTLTQTEWNYVFNTRTTASGIRYAKANVNNINGVILLPDDWNTDIYSLNNPNISSANFSSNTIFASQWTILESAGAVFLPAAGYRIGASSVSNAGTFGSYWSASNHESSACDVTFNDSNLNPTNYYGRYHGQSVRLVSTLENIITKTVTVTSNPIEGGGVSGGGTYQQGQSCTVSATAATGYTFNNWTENGSVVSTNANYTFTVNNNRTLVANFSVQAPTYTISVSSYPTNGGSVTGGGSYNYGQSCTVTATASPDYTFLWWTVNGIQVSTNANYTFTVTSDRTLVARFSINQPPTGAINGLFTINSNGDQVFFSKGNLQFKASMWWWQFATNQYDYIGNNNSNISQTYGGWIDLFGWGTSGWNCGSTYYHPWDFEYPSSGSYGPPVPYNLTDEYANSDWGGYNGIDNGGYFPGLWRTLTQSEWSYVFNQRLTASGCRYARAQVNGVNGVILLPDDWNTNYYNLSYYNNSSASYTDNVINRSSWMSILEAHGCVFLPAAGNRYQTLINNVGSYGYYWSASHYDNNSTKAYGLFFDDSYLSPQYDFPRFIGCSVRLVKDY